MLVRFELKNIAQPVTGFQWRPTVPSTSHVDDVPAIAITPIAAVPARQETREAAADFQEQLTLRLSRRTGIHVLALEEGGDLTATYLLRGRLRAGSASARLTLSLVLRESGRVFWSDSYESSADIVPVKTAWWGQDTITE